jgi:phenylacetic acid degradation operon negative regulatory protein
MPVTDPLRKRLQAFQQQPRMQAGSLIVSVFGDAIHPRGGVVWLGCLIRLLEPLALNERLIRTAIFRLVKQEWLETHSHGRRTDYGLSLTGRSRIEEASKLIYGGSKLKWDAHWRIILTNPDASAQSRSALRKALYWQGFGEWNASTFLHPSADVNQVIASLHAEGLAQSSDELLTFVSKLISTPSTIDNKQVVEQAWDLKHLAQGYSAFLRQYAGMDLAVNRPSNNEHAFLLRILLVHDFRRLLLRDPMLPASLLPARWTGLEARQLFNQLYLQLQEASEEHLDSELQRADASTPRRGLMFSKRIAAMRADSTPHAC